MEPRYKIGDKVVLIGNTNNDKNRVGLPAYFDEKIGQTFTISGFKIREKLGRTYITFSFENDNGWIYDEQWLAPYEIDTSELDKYFSEY